jgi:hypothetical protein
MVESAIHALVALAAVVSAFAWLVQSTGRLGKFCVARYSKKKGRVSVNGDLVLKKWIDLTVRQSVDRSRTQLKARSKKVQLLHVW